MRDRFFEQQNCERCGGDLSARTCSWFTTETICMSCSCKEDEVRARLPDKGRSYEGCGYVPEVSK